MTSLCDFLKPRNLLLAGAITLEVLLNACSGAMPAPSATPQPTVPENYCKEFKHQQFVPYGVSFIIRDIYDGKITDVVEVKVPANFLDSGTLTFIVLVQTRTSYPFDVDEITNEGIKVTYGPYICFDSPTNTAIRA